MKPPYGVIWRELLKGSVIPFLGAGASFTGETRDAAGEPRIAASPPNGKDLALSLAAESELPSADARDREDLAKVSSYYEDVSGRPALRSRLREVFSPKYPCGQIHRLLAAVPAHLLIVVTNYDTLLEQAFEAAGKPYDLVVYPCDRKDFANAVLWWRHGEDHPQVRNPNELEVDLTATTVIYKMHGTVSTTADWDNYVITEEDYVEFLLRMTSSTAIPASFFEHFQERSFLFLGYSLRDWNLRVVLKNLSRCLSRRAFPSAASHEPPPSWAIQRDPSELECALWGKRRVSIFKMTIDDFVRDLKERVQVSDA